MKTIKAGKFTIEVSDAYPVWVRLFHEDGGGVGSVVRAFDHRELRDLEYVVTRAIHAARAELPENLRAEID